MNSSTDKIRKDIQDLRDRLNPAYDGDLTHPIVRGMLVIVRRLKTNLEVAEAEMEKN